MSRLEPKSMQKQQSHYENKNHISIEGYQYKINGVDGFNREYNCGHGENHFGHLERISINMVLMGLIVQLGIVKLLKQLD